MINFSCFFKITQDGIEKGRRVARFFKVTARKEVAAKLFIWGSLLLFLVPIYRLTINSLISESHLLVMSLLEESHGNPIPLSTSNEDFLIREIVLTHDPDDRQLDSEMLLNLVESTFCYTTENVIVLCKFMFFVIK